jgi:hypothetical protein
MDFKIFYEFISLSEAVKSFDSEDFYEIISKYKFVLAMENAVCEDYM